MSIASHLGIGMFLSSALLTMALRSSCKKQLSQLKRASTTCSKATAEAHAARQQRKGSFLLQTPTQQSEAALVARSSTKIVGSSNATVGKKLIEQRDKSMGPNVSVFYKQDGGLVITSGSGANMIDIDGNKHLDCCNNVACVGHAHPAVVAAGQKEMANVQTNGRFLNPIQQRYVAKLLATFPPELNTVYFVNSGSEANDLALRMAREANTAKRSNDVIILDSAYHGHTQSLVDISPYKWYQATDGKNYHPATTHVAALPDSFRGKYRGGQTDETGKLYAAEVEELVRSPDGGIGTFIAESILGCGGQIVPPPGYFQRCYEAVRAQGGICIADEVQTGFARTGTHFWCFQAHGVVPDIVTVGKPMGNGYPVAAVICKREVADAFAKTGIEYFNTYGGNSVACAVAEAVLDTIHNEQLQSQALRVGAYLSQQLQSRLLHRYDFWVGEVRGMGLFQGIEFIQNIDAVQGTSERVPHPELTKFLVDFLRYQCVIVSRDGPDENVIKVKPPLVFSEQDVDKLVTALEDGLECAVKLGHF